MIFILEESLEDCRDTQVVSVKGEIRNEGNVVGNSAMGGIVGYATDEDAKNTGYGIWRYCKSG